MATITKLKSYIELGYKAADCVEKTILSPGARLVLPTGSTPLSMYKELVSRKLDWSTITTYNLDEYLNNKNPEQAYSFYMNKFFFKYINISKINFPNKTNISKKNNYGYCVDLCILGIGANGHIAFNEPGSSFDSETRIVNLSEQTRKDNSRFFSSINEVPKQAITMGLKTIMSSKKVLLLAKGKKKEMILKKAFYEEITEKIPASILQKHKNLTIYYCD